MREEKAHPGGRKRRLFLGMALAAAALFGFFLGRVVGADTGAPGSASDPLVAKSYVDEQVSSYVRDLEGQIAALEKKAAELEQQLARLRQGTGTAVQSSAGSSSVAQGQAAAEQLLRVTEENSYVNLRQGPGTDYPLVGKVVRNDPSSEPMTVLGKSGDWYHVRLPDGRTGWVAAWLVTPA